MILAVAPVRSRPVAVAILALLAGCGADSTDEDVKTELPLPDGLTGLRVRLGLGDVTVGIHAGERTLRIDGRLRRSAADPDDFEQLLHVAFEPRLTPTQDPGVFQLAAPALPAGVDAERSAIVFRTYLSLPEDVAIDVETRRGDLEVRYRKAPVRLRTERGELALRDVHADADVATIDGKLFAVGHRGGLRARCGDPLRPTLTGGSIFACVEAIGSGGIDLWTNSPSLQLELPAGAAFELDAEVSESARGKVGIRTAFGLPIEAEGEGHRCRGAVGGGGAKVRAALRVGWLSVSSR
ncbi:MAG: hypothetical protein HZB39_10970 [Planctomycetes bacterium]|nr:hypothetical protein [Planctomycetota bacterium]